MWQNIACGLIGLFIGELVAVLIICFMMGASDKEDQDMVLYMLVTRDKFELPVSPALSCKEMAQYLGIKEDSVRFRTSPVYYRTRDRQINDTGRPKLIKVKISEEQ